MNGLSHHHLLAHCRAPTSVFSIPYLVFRREFKKCEWVNRHADHGLSEEVNVSYCDEGNTYYVII